MESPAASWEMMGGSVIHRRCSFLDLLSFIHNEQCNKRATDHLKGEKFFTWLPYMVIWGHVLCMSRVTLNVLNLLQLCVRVSDQCQLLQHVPAHQSRPDNNWKTDWILKTGNR